MYNGIQQNDEIKWDDIECWYRMGRGDAMEQNVGQDRLKQDRMGSDELQHWNEMGW